MQALEEASGEARDCLRAPHRFCRTFNTLPSSCGSEGARLLVVGGEAGNGCPSLRSRRRCAESGAALRPHANLFAHLETPKARSNAVGGAAPLQHTRRFSNASSQRLLEAPCLNENAAESASARSWGPHRGNGGVSIGRKLDGGSPPREPADELRLRAASSLRAFLLCASGFPDQPSEKRYDESIPSASAAAATSSTVVLARRIPLPT
jgi:hypothetical protein